jgi:hypothetical protein
MKTLLRFFAFAILLSSCSEPKLRLRAPEAAASEKQVKNDSLRKDSTGIGKKKLAN